MKTDMSAQAITVRLKQTSELSRLCIALAATRLRTQKQTRINKNDFIRKSQDDED